MATDTTEVKAIARYIRISPYKVRRVLDQIRGRSYREALIILEFMPYRACEPVLKVLRSAAANAEHNAGLDRAELVITQASNPERKEELIKSANRPVILLLLSVQVLLLLNKQPNKHSYSHN
jgi:ribosomal protein L22